MNNQKGFALVITLIITALLVALSVQFIDEVYVDTSISHNFVAGQQASLLAASGVDGAVKLIQYTQQTQSFSSLLDMWAKPLLFEEEQGKLVVSIEEESGKLNINAIALPNGSRNGFYYDRAVRLFKKLGLSPDLLDGVIDWVDTNDEPQPAGGESAYYSRLKPPYQPRNGKLDTLEELRLVRGFDTTAINKLRPFITVYNDPGSQAASININTAPKEVLFALSEEMTDDLVSRIEDRRKTTPFKSDAELNQIPGFERIAMGLMGGAITAKGTTYRIHSEAFVKETSRVVEAVFRTTDSKFLYWREY